VFRFVTRESIIFATAWRTAIDTGMLRALA
jgi:hypothetical protein